MTPPPLTHPNREAAFAGRLERVWSSALVGRLSDVSMLLDGLSGRDRIAEHLIQTEAGVGLIDGTPEGVRDVARFRSVLKSALSSSTVTSERLLRWHAIVAGGHPSLHPGEFRRTSSPRADADLRSADWALPAPAEMYRRLDELIDYANGGGDHPIVLATVLMGEFDAIRPFMGGNGRMCRALFHWALSREWDVVPPISVVWTARPTRLRTALDSWRTGSHPDLWLNEVVEDLAVVGRAGAELDAALVELGARWAALGAGRAGSLRRRMLRDLLARPVVDSTGAAVRVEADPSRFSRVARELVSEGILVAQPESMGKVGRPTVRYEAVEVRDLVDRWSERLGRAGTVLPGAPDAAEWRLERQARDRQVDIPAATRGRPVPSKTRRST